MDSQLSGLRRRTGHLLYLLPTYTYPHNNVILELIPVPLAQDESFVRNWCDGLGFYWPLGLTTSGECYGSDAYERGAGGAGSEIGCSDIESRERWEVGEAHGGGYRRLRQKMGGLS